MKPEPKSKSERKTKPEAKPKADSDARSMGKEVVAVPPAPELAPATDPAAVPTPAKREPKTKPERGAAEKKHGKGEQLSTDAISAERNVSTAEATAESAPTEADGRTWLVTRLCTVYEWSRPWVLVTVLLMEVGDYPMMRRMLRGIRERAETLHRQAAGTGPGAPAAGLNVFPPPFSVSDFTPDDDFAETWTVTVPRTGAPVCFPATPTICAVT